MRDAGRLVRRSRAHRRKRSPESKPSAPPWLLSGGAFLSSTSIGRRRSILCGCGCGGWGPWADGSEVGERRGRRSGAAPEGKEHGGRGSRRGLVGDRGGRVGCGALDRDRGDRYVSRRVPFLISRLVFVSLAEYQTAPQI
jgi:hypothetical protein